MQPELPEGVSRTAIGVGVLRALHTLIDAEPWVINDPVSGRLFGEIARARMDADLVTMMGDERAHALRGHVLVRSAFAESRLAAAVARGVRQYVVLGAGFDTFAYRQPAWMEGGRVFEVDTPVTQGVKRRWLAAAGIAEPSNVVYAPIDFERQTLSEGLHAAGVDPSAPAFFSWLGVMMYLTRDAIDAVFAAVAAMPAGSEIAFTFRPQADSSDPLTQRVAAFGEPFRTALSAGELAALVLGHGFHEILILSPDDAQRYLGKRTDRLRLPERASIATAVV
jgi:methyltransferase (TIGR00027 family)